MPGGPNSLFIGRHFSVARLRVEPHGRGSPQGTVDDFVAGQSTLDQSVSTSFNTNDRKRFGIK